MCHATHIALLSNTDGRNAHQILKSPTVFSSSVLPATFTIRSVVRYRRCESPFATAPVTRSPAFTTDASNVRATTLNDPPSSLLPSHHTTSAPSLAPAHFPRLYLFLRAQKQRIKSRNRHNLLSSIPTTSLHAPSVYPSICLHRLPSISHRIPLASRIMSAPNNGGKPRRAEYTAPSRKNARAAQKPMRDIGVEQFKRPGGTLLGAGHVRPGSAFDTLARKKGRDRFEVARDQVGGKTGAGDEADLDCKTGRDNDTDDPADAPDARGDMPGQVPTPLDLDESLWGKQDDTDEAIEPQESNQQESTNKILQNLRPNVVRTAPASRNLKANAGAWGASKLKEPEKDVVDTAARPTAAHLTAANRAMIRRRLLAVKNKPTAEEHFR
jgi:hypothetical protein